MLSAVRDLWPEDIRAQDVLTPQEILHHQADVLERRTNSLLVGDVPQVHANDRVVLGFEVYVPRIDTRARLFDVQHRLEFEYPAVVIPPDSQLPNFLKRRRYRPGVGGIAGSLAAMSAITEGKWVDTPWVATSPMEFSSKVEEVLAFPEVKAVVLSLLARANRSEDENGADSPADQASSP